MPASGGGSGLAGAALEVRDLVIAHRGIGTVVSAAALRLGAGAVAAVEGPSGAGKSSLLHALAGIERPSAGSVRWDGDAVWDLGGAARDRWRRRRLGLVFQDMHLLDAMSALENVLLPVRFDHARVPGAVRARAAALLEGLGVAPASRAAGVMSRGERQRVALARALLREPAVLLADEPTASLDAVAAAQVGALLLRAAAETGATLLVATHDPALLALIPARWRITGGVVRA